jgi:hypothetical protein
MHLSEVCRCLVASHQKDVAMAKVLHLFMIELRPGVKGEDFEKFYRETFAPSAVSSFPDLKLSLLKGDRGDREGKYLEMAEYESIEARNRLYPAPDQISAELAKFAESALIKEFVTFAPMPWISTDYVLVSETKSAM